MCRTKREKEIKAAGVETDKEIKTEKDRQRKPTWLSDQNQD